MKRPTAIKPPDYDVAHVYAMKALANGSASPDQQQMAMRWIIEGAAGTYQDTHYPTDRDTTFANGRRYVGLRLVTMINMPASVLAKMTRGTDERNDIPHD